MKFAVGFPVCDDPDRPFVEVVDEFRDRIGEVYFAWPGEPSGRSAASDDGGFEESISAFRDMGVRLDLLFNANCYGREAWSKALGERVARIVDQAQPDVVTTASPFIAQTLKSRDPNLELRASVNMRIGTIEAAGYLADIFDSFYLQRDYNRDFDRLRDLKTWCDERGKRLLLLANSGCLRFCSTQTFHDNLVAHEAQVSQTANVACEVLACRSFLAWPENLPALLQATWIRPEDLHHYEPYFPLVKLATRMHARPDFVLRAYAQGTYAGNLTDLLEPGHAHVLAGRTIDNARFPDDWFRQTSACNKKCHACSYCRETLARVCG